MFLATVEEKDIKKIRYRIVPNSLKTKSFFCQYSKIINYFHRATPNKHIFKL